jgi:oligosaccharyltransferase complex subunit alpha (ribophorin I)
LIALLIVLSISEWTVYKITLDPPIAPGESTVLGLRMAYTNRYLQVQPEHVPQDKPQYLRWESSATIRSLYFSEEQSTKIKVPSQHVESYSKGPEPMERNKAGNEFTYGPYKDVEANAARKPIYLYYEQNIAPITAVDHKRQLEVSHWGGYLAVEEHYNIRHDGAK